MEKNTFIILSVFVLAASSCFLCGQATQEQVVVVSASKLPKTVEKTGSSVSLVEGTVISTRGDSDIVSAMEYIPGVHIGRNGGIGRTSAVYLRGANPEHVKVFVNGQEINDPLGFGRGAELSGFSAMNIERIEIIKGAQSSLYGSDAMAGVINILTKKGGEKQTSLFAEGGSYGTYRYSAATAGGDKKFGYNVDYNWFETKGFSMADEKDGNTEDDGFRSGTLSLRINGIVDVMEYDVYSRYADEEADLDGSSHGKLEDTFNDIQKKTSIYGQGKIAFELFDSFWRPEARAAVTVHKRDYYNENSRSAYDSEVNEAEWQNTIRWEENHVSVAGTAFRTEKGESWSSGTYTSKFENKSADTASIYLEDNISIGDSFAGSGCVRVDEHDIAGHSSTWRIAPVLKTEKGFALRASYGTGFKAPSLYQLYSPYGNEKLKSEKSRSTDAGIEYSSENGKFTASAVYFYDQYDSLIDFEYQTWKYTNIAESISKGYELSSKINLSDTDFILLSFTRVESEDGAGKQLKRRPKNRAVVEAGTTLLAKLDIRASGVYVGKRNDYDFSSGSDVELDDYVLLNLSANYRLSDNIKLHARIENILDENYQEAFGYGTAGLSAYGGMEYTF